MLHLFRKGSFCSLTRREGRYLSSMHAAPPRPLRHPRMILIYRTPAVIPPEVLVAFAAHGIRLLPGDAIAHEMGKRPVAMRELPHDVIHLLHHFDVESVDGAPVPSGAPAPPLPGPHSRLSVLPGGWGRKRSPQAG